MRRRIGSGSVKLNALMVRFHSRRLASATSASTTITPNGTLIAPTNAPPALNICATGSDGSVTFSNMLENIQRCTGPLDGLPVQPGVGSKGTQPYFGKYTSAQACASLAWTS